MAGRTILLLGAVLLPILYFGVQGALAPTFPHYSFLTDSASMLGSDRAPYAAVFNTVAIASGVVGLAGALGFFLALRAEQCPLVLTILIGLAVAVTAAGCIWAGVFPLPDPRHGANPTVPGTLALPLLFAAAAFLVPRLRVWRPYFIANLVVMVVVLLILFGVIAVDRNAYGGLLQRLLALVCFVPIGVAGTVLWRRPA